VVTKSVKLYGAKRYHEVDMAEIKRVEDRLSLTEKELETFAE